MSTDLEPTPAEQKLIDAAAKGEVADYRVGEKDADNPANGENWGDDRTLRAEIIYALCVGTQPEWKVHAKGVWAVGARIVGDLDFESATLRGRLGLISCLIDKRITLRDARTRTLNFSGSHCRGISADRLVVEGSVFLREGFNAKGQVRFRSADIGGSFDCSGARFENPEGDALSADGLVTKGDVFLSEGFSAEGEVRLLGAHIGGDLFCGGARFENPGGKALSADSLVTKGGVFFRERVTDKDERQPFVAKGEVRLLGADIGGNLTCVGARFENPSGRALTADSLVTKGGVFLRQGFNAKGELRLVGAAIGGVLSCVGALFENPGGRALTADRLVTKGGVFLRERVTDKNEREPFTAKGEVRLLGADIGGNLECTGARFENPDGNALNAENMQVNGGLFWRDLAAPPAGCVNLGHAKLGQLLDDEGSWPVPGNLILDGFVYGAIAGNAPTSASERLRWLHLQPKDHFYPQPYEQLVRVLRQMGHERDAREIAIAKQEDLRKSGALSPVGRAWNGFLGATIAHGYKPWRVLWYIAAALALGWVFFTGADSHGVMRPAKERILLDPCYVAASQKCAEKGWIEIPKNDPLARAVRQPRDYPRFYTVVYTIDVFFPIVDLRQEAYWLPTTDAPAGWFYLGYMWLHIVAGWVLTTVGVVGLTGIVKQD